MIIDVVSCVYDFNDVIIIYWLYWIYYIGNKNNFYKIVLNILFILCYIVRLVILEKRKKL